VCDSIPKKSQDPEHIHHPGGRRYVPTGFTLVAKTRALSSSCKSKSSSPHPTGKRSILLDMGELLPAVEPPSRWAMDHKRRVPTTTELNMFSSHNSASLDQWAICVSFLQTWSTGVEEANPLSNPVRKRYPTNVETANIGVKNIYVSTDS
jgi:hypothetical protein